MSRILLNPEDHVQVPAYHHVAVATGTRQIHVAGQVSWDADGVTVAAGDLAGQVAQVLRNVHKSLQIAGATFADVVRITWYVVDWEPGKADAFLAGLQRAASEFGPQTPPAAVIGVNALWSPDFLVEAEVTAVID
ncbi:RidA family protein [Mycobacterium sp. AMU20-3851]|uniref:RidA family protein n=1 Tax=Mycobacterium sp. AMU20-3851 TaxID=3122055 RepID=UPI003754E779